MINDIEIIKSQRPTNLEEIAEFEKLIDAKLPEDYKQFLLKHNGGHPVMNGFELIETINDKESSGAVSWFFPLYEGDSNLLLWFKLTRNKLPDEYIPIGYDNGDSICLVIKGENYGKVYYYTSDWSYWSEEDYNYIYLISNSFTEFINGLYKVEYSKDHTETRTYQDGTVKIIPPRPKEKSSPKQ